MRTWIKTAAVVVLLGSTALGGPRLAAADDDRERGHRGDRNVLKADAVLYELTENLSYGALLYGYRKASSELFGYAAVGTPLCPEGLVKKAKFCTINASGRDNISLATGLGGFEGTLTVVANFDNEVDGPELVIAAGSFKGDMDFALAILKGIPMGFVTGTVSLNGGTEQPFKGTFRLPFVTRRDGSPRYLVDLAKWKTQAVADNETAIGYPTVRFEINFD